MKQILLCVFMLLFFSTQAQKGWTKDRIERASQDAENKIDAGKYAEAIGIYLAFDDAGVATVHDYSNLGWCYLITKQFTKALKYLQKGQELDDAELYLQGNLAHAYLLTGDFEKANAIYQQYRGENIDEKLSWEKAIENDFKEFKKKGISSPKFQEILDSFKVAKE